MDDMRGENPLADAEELARFELDSPAQLRGLRAGLRRALTADGDQPAEMLDRMAVVATEFATNALKYGGPPAVVRLYRTGDSFILDVADRDLGRLPEYAEARPLGEGGLGLPLARALAHRVSWFVTDVAKHVRAWFPTGGHARSGAPDDLIETTRG
jgi:serine/threonine-protein kinase RsbW